MVKECFAEVGIYNSSLFNWNWKWFIKKFTITELFIKWINKKKKTPSHFHNNLYFNLEKIFWQKIN
jgi:hypothetical protein